MLTVRRAHPGDYAAVAALTTRVYGDGGWSTPDYLPLLADTAARDRAGEVWVALDAAGALLGSLSLFTAGAGPDWAELSHPGEGEMRMLAVAPAARGRGVGAALVEAALERARARGWRRMLLSTRLDMHAAHRLYQRFGFARAPERDWEPVPGERLMVFARAL